MPAYLALASAEWAAAANPEISQGQGERSGAVPEKVTSRRHGQPKPVAPVLEAKESEESLIQAGQSGPAA